jgi:hypothetical protein
MTLTPKQRANLFAGMAVFGCAILFSFSPADYHFYPICPFYATTHLLCPGCGGTRALYQLLHLHVVAAWHLNALVTLCAPVSLLWFCFWYYRVIRHGHDIRIAVPRLAIASAYALTILFAVIRNTTSLFRI